MSNGNESVYTETITYVNTVSGEVEIRGCRVVTPTVVALKKNL